MTAAKVSVIGLGYVGTPLAAVLADAGFNVIGIQRMSHRSGWKIDWINRGKSPISGNEPWIGELIRVVSESGRLRATDDLGEIANSEIVVITVQTPLNERKEPDFSILIEACEQVGRNITAGTLVCLESTVPPGTTENIVKPILERESGLRVGDGFNLVFCYERVTPGYLIENLKTLPRVVGGITTQCTERGAEFYEKITEATVFKTDPCTAETSKLIENSHRDVNIAFANEAALICKSLGVDFYDVRRFVNSLPMRPGSSNPYRNLLEPGAGVGGHCLPKDSYLLLYSMRRLNPESFPRLIILGREINESMPDVVRDMIIDGLGELGRSISDSKIGILGLSYKADSEDARNSPTLCLINKLESSSVYVHDPYITDNSEVKTHSLIDTVLGSDCLVVMTKHKEYEGLELKRIASLMRTRFIVDGRCLFDPIECAKKGFVYRGLEYVTV